MLRIPGRRRVAAKFRVNLPVPSLRLSPAQASRRPTQAASGAAAPSLMMVTPGRVTSESECQGTVTESLTIHDPPTVTRDLEPQADSG